MASQIIIGNNCYPANGPFVVSNYTGVLTEVCTPECPIDVNVLSMPAVTPTTTFDTEVFVRVDAVTGHPVRITTQFNELTGALVAGFPQYLDMQTGSAWLGSPATLTQSDFEIVSSGKTDLCMGGVNITREDYKNTDPNGPAIPSVFRDSITGVIFTPTAPQLASMVAGHCETAVADHPYREVIAASSSVTYPAGTIKSLTYSVIGTGATMLPAFTGVTQNLLDTETATFTADTSDSLTDDITFTTSATSTIVVWIVAI